MGNFTSARTSTGTYVITFVSPSPLASVNLTGYPCVVSLNESIGFISGGGSGVGTITVNTYSFAGALIDRSFNFVFYKP